MYLVSECLYYWWFFSFLHNAQWSCTRRRVKTALSSFVTVFCCSAKHIITGSGTTCSLFSTWLNCLFVFCFTHLHDCAVKKVGIVEKVLSIFSIIACFSLNIKTCLQPTAVWHLIVLVNSMTCRFCVGVYTYWTVRAIWLYHYCICTGISLCMNINNPDLHRRVYTKCLVYSFWIFNHLTDIAICWVPHEMGTSTCMCLTGSAARILVSHFTLPQNLFEIWQTYMYLG